ncbi:MAG: hypothetical protein FJX59_02605 [Alphaproteobacteria bacterium]|nr:hypothetical protein [Alphaproteobacteria bacterium]
MQTVTLDVKSVARQRGPHQPRHPVLPPAILTFIKHWVGLSEDKPPRWHLFQMLGVMEQVPYLAIFKCVGGSAFMVEFMGSAVSAMIGDDMTGMEFNSSTPTVAEIDWYERCQATLEQRDVTVLTGTANPKYTSKLDYVGADYPFIEDAGDDVAYVVTLTVGKAN